MIIWASAAFAGFESIRKLIEHGHTARVAAGIAGAVLGIIGIPLVAWYKLRVGKRINSRISAGSHPRTCPGALDRPHSASGDRGVG